MKTKINILFQVLKNKIFQKTKKFVGRFSHIDRNCKIHKKAKIISSEIYGNVIIDENSVIHKTLISGDVTIGKNTTLWGPNIQILSIKNSIKIGNFCSIARDVTIQEYFHDYNKLTTYFIGRNVFGENIETEVMSKGAIEIGNDVWIGTGVQIMSGIIIGNGAVIAANSTVTHNVPPYSIVAGVPAKIIKYRFSKEIIEKLLKIEWWNWDIEKIKQNKKIFVSKKINKKIFIYENDFNNCSLL